MTGRKRKPAQPPVKPPKTDVEEQLQHGHEFMNRYEKMFKAVAAS